MTAPNSDSANVAFGVACGLFIAAMVAVLVVAVVFGPPSHGESAPGSRLVQTRQLAGLTEISPDTVTPGHFCGEGRL